MAFHLTYEEHQKVCDAWKPSYTKDVFKELCYLLEHAESGIPLELGPLERYSPENLYEYISEARFLTAVQIAVADYAQDSHRVRVEGSEFTTPNFWENIKVLGYPSQFFWVDLQVLISDMLRTSWHTVARLYDINDKMTPEEEERYKEAREKTKKILKETKNLEKIPPVPSKEEIDAIVQKSKEMSEATEKKLYELRDQLVKNTEALQQLEVSKPWWKRMFNTVRISPTA